MTSQENNYEFVSGRDIAALQDARPACIIGACGDDGEVCFATVIWVTPISHNPAMVAFALRAKSHTMSIIQKTGRFSISVPPADAEGIKLVEFCGGNTGRMIDKGAVVAHNLVSIAASSTSKENAESAEGTESATQITPLVPVLEHAYSWEVGTIESIQEAGDHLLAIGTITRAATQSPRDEKGLLIPADTLLCIQHGHYGKVDEIEKPA